MRRERERERERGGESKTKKRKGKMEGGRIKGEEGEKGGHKKERENGWSVRQVNGKQMKVLCGDKGAILCDCGC